MRKEKGGNQPREFLHGAITLWAFHGLRDLTHNHWEIKAVARTSNVMDLALVILDGQIKALDRHLVLPQVILNQCLQNCGLVTIDHNIRPLAKHNPSTFSIVAKQLLDFLHHRIMVIKLA
ncbi:hypothetical protein NC652_003496 [Populus alba x Populus x berolinensis]|nr:hypothetical protein NC652_003496 [Populus alba x Populus x berolinensis]